MTARRKPQPGCVDCPPSSKRKAPHPGPRCATHNRLVKAQRRDRSHGQRIEQTYNLTLERFRRILEAQSGRCAVCDLNFGKRKRPSVDHDHACCDGPTSCGSCVRGLLHNRCNQLLGYMRDDPETFRRAADYLEHPPAKDVA